MRLAVISFTKSGSWLCGKLTKRLQELGYACMGYVQPRFLNEVQEVTGLCPLTGSLNDWTEQQFRQAEGLIYIGAAGIAVRAIAPFIKDKMTDPAVVVLDEQAQFAISLLSGHIGGANELTGLVSEITGAMPVITTATDVNRKTAIDVWAKQRGLMLSDRILAKETAAALLAEEAVGFYSDYPLTEPVPEGFIKGELGRLQVWLTARVIPGGEHMVSWFCEADGRILRLIPPSLAVGVGCRKGVSAAVIETRIRQVFDEANLDMRAIAGLFSIDLKQQEEGLLKTAANLQVPFCTYSAEILQNVTEAESPVHDVRRKVHITSSDFVQAVTGVDNVCERAALAGAGTGAELLVCKQAGDGVTVAVAEKMMEIGMRVEE